MQGRCACGAVVYRVTSKPYDAGWCHCRTCQRVSGSPALAFATVPFDDWQIVEGAEHLGKFKSSDFGERQYCKSCGTPLTIHVTHQPNEIDFTLASMEQPSVVSPEFHLFVSEQIKWATICDDLPRHDKLRPDTRGLNANQTTL